MSQSQLINSRTCGTTLGDFRGFFFLRKAASVLTSVFLLFSVISCTTLPQKEVPVQKETLLSCSSISWIKVKSQGQIEYALLYDKSIPVRVHVVKVNLLSGVQPVTYPSGSEQKDSKLKALTTQEFAKNTNAAIAVNASPFGCSRNPLSRIFKGKRTITGLHFADGTMFSPPVEKYCALVIKQHKDDGTKFSAQIEESQSVPETQDTYIALGGFFQILRDSEIIEYRRDIKDARTAAGITTDGTVLYLMTVEKNSKSTGLSYPDCALLFKNLGCTNAMQFDGGSSAQMVVEGKTVTKMYSVPQANHLGFK